MSTPMAEIESRSGRPDGGQLERPKLTVKDFKGLVEPDWCPGCGDFGVLIALKQALVELGLQPHEVMTVSGIGCSSNLPGYVNAYGMHTLHGRSLAVASGAQMANHRGGRTGDSNAWRYPGTDICTPRTSPKRLQRLPVHYSWRPHFLDTPYQRKTGTQHGRQTRCADPLKPGHYGSPSQAHEVGIYNPLQQRQAQTGDRQQRGTALSLQIVTGLPTI